MLQYTTVTFIFDFVLLSLHLMGKVAYQTDMDKTSGWQGEKQLSFFTIPQEHRTLILYAESFQKSSSTSET